MPRLRYIGDVNGVAYPDLGPYLLNGGDVFDLDALGVDEEKQAGFLQSPNFEQVEDDAELTVLIRGDEPAEEAPLEEEEPPAPPTIAEQVASARSHAALHTLAGEIGVEVPDDAKAAWGEATTVDDKRAILVAKLAEEAPVEAEGEQVSGVQGDDVTEEASAGTD